MDVYGGYRSEGRPPMWISIYQKDLHFSCELSLLTENVLFLRAAITGNFLGFPRDFLGNSPRIIIPQDWDPIYTDVCTYKSQD